MARRCSTICLPVGKDAYQDLVADPERFRAWLDQAFRDCPELFPPAFADGYRLKDARCSAKTGLRLRRVRLKATGRSYSVRPSFVLPYQAGTADDVADALFPRGFGVPFWALARVFGRDHDYWYRLEVGLGRNSVVGTTARGADLPEHLLADEHHQTRDGQKNYAAATVGAGCCPGAALAPTAGADDLRAAYAVFKDEAEDVRPGYRPKTVSVDGWAATSQAWRGLFAPVVLLRCFLHGWLNIPGQVGRGVRRPVEESVGRLPRARPKAFRAAPASAVGVGQGERQAGVGTRAGQEAVRPVEGVWGGVRPPGWAPDEQHVGPGDAPDESVLRPRPTPARVQGGGRGALPCVGVAVQLPSVAPGDGAGQRGLGQPGRAIEPAPLP
jgi:hypothetical protein